MKTFIRTLALAAFLGATALPSFAQDESPFNKGAVYILTTVRTQANSQDDYLKQLDQYWYPSMVKAKALGLIKDFHILAGEASNKEDYDVMTIIELNNLAELDPSPEREAKWKQVREAMEAQAGSQEKVKSFSSALNNIRELLGEKVMREQVHK